MPFLSLLIAITSDEQIVNYIYGNFKPSTHYRGLLALSATNRIRDKYNETQRKIVYYLNAGLRKGNHYFKSKYIARDLGLSPKEVGTNLGILAEICEELQIIKWSYSNSTTWMVTHKAYS